ncbi:MAG: ATP-binding protein [Clostridia bacterium]|nr:ATP-binding protein [Clostridia bacterium]
MPYIHRHIEDVLLRSGNTFKSVLLTGARQTGKSTMLRELLPELSSVSLDDEFLEEQARETPSMFLALNPPPVIYDEVQRAPNLFRQIKIACDETEEKGRFYLSGSQPIELMQEASESLSGRVSVLELSTLSLREILGVTFNKPFLPTMEYVAERNKEVLRGDNIWKIIHRGGYPALQEPDMDWSQFFSSYVKTYLERDVRSITGVQDLDAFRKFMISVAARTGQMLNYSNIADEIGKDQTTVRRWMSILEASGIVYLLEPYTNSVLKRAIKTPKVYFRDTGLAAYLTRWLTPETLANGAMSGAFFETFVVSEILKSYSNRGLDYRYFVSYYRGKDNHRENEIDLIIEQDGVLYPIEIKQSEQPTAKETSAFTILDKIEEKKRGMGAVVCMAPQPGQLRENVLAIPVWFL